MARNPVVNATPNQIAAIDLDRVLIRLEKKILTSGGDPKLQRSSYERSRAASTLEYARTLLIRLEHDTLKTQQQTRKATERPSFSRQRVLLKRLTDRMHELERTSQDDPNEIYGPEDGELIADLLSREEVPSTAHSLHHSTHNNAPQPTSGRPPSPPSTLRNRFQTPAHLQSNAPSTSPLAPSPSSPSSPFPSNSDDAAISAAERLQHADSRSAELTSSLLTLAKQLKTSSAQFQTSLAADDEALKRATEGLDKSESQMEVTRRRMGLLTRMSEGEGWLGRMMLYAWIGGLWIVAIALVFVGPKFRF